MKEALEAKFEAHNIEKEKVRELKDQCKEEASTDSTVLCASFDLQQANSLPISNERSFFNKRRLFNFNLTFYDIEAKDCQCYTWSEAQSKCGASELSTAVYQALQLYDKKGVKTAYLFSDGCGGQNKNSITPAMMLYMLSKSANMEDISLRFFETYHRQNEGDSAHSAINHPLKSAEDVFHPLELGPIFKLARPPYIVHQLDFDDFLDFKTLSKDLRILNAPRQTDTDEPIRSNDIIEPQV